MHQRSKSKVLKSAFGLYTAFYNIGFPKVADQGPLATLTLRNQAPVIPWLCPDSWSQGSA
jgi:hypothetical protein